MHIVFIEKHYTLIREWEPTSMPPLYLPCVLTRRANIRPLNLLIFACRRASACEPKGRPGFGTVSVGSDRRAPTTVPWRKRASRIAVLPSAAANLLRIAPPRSAVALVSSRDYLVPFFTDLELTYIRL